MRPVLLVLCLLPSSALAAGDCVYQGKPQKYVACLYDEMIAMESTLTARIEALESDLAAAQSTIADLEDELSATNASLDDLTLAVDDLGDADDDLDLRLAEVEADYATATDLEALAATVDAYHPTERLVFVTSGVYLSGQDFASVDGADAICQDLAESAGLSGTFLAWISDGSTSPSERFVQSEVPYVRTDGTEVASDWDDLTDDSLSASISVTEAGDAISSAVVWTSTNTDGTAVGSIYDACGDWATDYSAYVDTGGSSPGNSTPVGKSSKTDFLWTGRRASGTGGTQSQACWDSARLYCFQQ